MDLNIHNTEPTIKDHKYLSWVKTGAKIFSTCAKRQYMAMVVDERGYVAGVGYNGTPSGFKHCIDGWCPRMQEQSTPGSNYDNCLSNHAEANAFINCSDRSAMVNATLYVNGEPCFTCAKLTANTGITRLVYTSDPDYEYPGWEEVKRFLMNASITVVYIPMEDLYE